MAKESQLVPFGEIARQISKRVEPSETDAKVYVGLEHLDPGCLRIKRTGSPADVKGQKLAVKPGQIIFGKRRAYQRKLAVSHFDGICSAHAMVLESNPDRIIPELLPFFMQSDMFMERAVAISEGSLSPTIKWKTLAEQQFPVPTITRQHEILTVLLCMEDCLIAAEDALDSGARFLNSLTRELMSKGIGHSVWKHSVIGELPAEWDAKNIFEVAECLDNLRVPIRAADRNTRQGPYPYYGASGVIDSIDDFIFEGEHVLLGEDGENINSRKLPLAFLASGRFWVNNHAHVFRPMPNNDAYFLAQKLESLDFGPFISGSSRPKITKGILEHIKMAMPPGDEQRRISSVLRETASIIDASTKRKALMTTLKAHAFGEMIG